MDKSGNHGLQPPHIKQDTNSIVDITNKSQETKQGEFKDKKVKANEGASMVRAREKDHTEYADIDQKKIIKDYDISVKEAKQHHPAPETSKQTTSTAKVDEGEFYFVDPLSKQQLIDRFRANQAPLTTICIRSLKDFEKNGLMTQTRLENGRLEKAEGRIFLDKALTLIFDLTVMSPSDIASINDILQEHPSFNGKQLGPQIKRVCLVNDEMLTGSRSYNPDLWRRLRLMSQKEILDTEQVQDSITDDLLLTQMIKETPPSKKKIVTIDFAQSDNWYQQLFGGISFNEKGQFIFSDGFFSNIDNDCHLIFKNAPWDSLGFKETIATAIREGFFEANGNNVAFPKNLTISNENISKTKLEILKKQLICDNSVFNPNSPIVCLNSHSIENLKSQNRIEGDKVVRTNMLATLLEGCDQLVLTDSLDDKQWLWLLAQLEKLPRQKNRAIFSNLPPSAYISSENAQYLVKHHPEECIQDLDPDKYFQYDVTSIDSLDSLCPVNLTSQNNFTFSIDNSLLFEKLIQKKLVIFNGLEKNPKLAASLETLLLPQPYLFIHGNKIELPGAQVRLIKSSDKNKVESSLINYVFSEYPDEEKAPENPVYSYLKTLPRTFKKDYPNAPPLDPEIFQKKFELQAQLEQEMDGSAKLMPCHKRRALNVLLAKPYRGNTNVYGFIKAKIAECYPDDWQEFSGDASAINHWLLKHPNVDRNMIRESFWTLAQYGPASIHQSVKGYNDFIDEEVIDEICLSIIDAAPKGTKMRQLAATLKVDPIDAIGELTYDGNLRSCLRDVYIANKALLKPDLVLNEIINNVEREIEDILREGNTDDEKKAVIRSAISNAFQNNQLPAYYEDLPELVFTNQRHVHAQQERRLTQLAQRVQKHSVVFLQGETGAGKTFMAQAIAERAGFEKGCQFIQLGPNKTAEDLFGGPKLITCTKDGVTDQSTKFQEGPILKWAQLTDPPLLVLDEANLAAKGILAPLAGLTKQPPVIYYRGHEYKLTDKHRIILTGNPDYYEGRSLDSTLRSCVPTFFYHPLPESLLVNAIIKPGLPEQWTDEMKQQASERLVGLFLHFQSLVPGDLTTPRDLKDVLATVRQILRHHDKPNELSKQQINAIIRRAFMDSLGGAVTVKQKKQLGALNTWYGQQFSEDLSIFKGVEKAFNDFLTKLKKEHPDTNFLLAPFQQLTYRYWQSLDKDDSGRVASVVEGPAGWGKDYILERVLEQWQKDLSEQKWALTPFVHINANTNQWSSLVDKVKEGMQKGQVIAISELNLIPSNYLEGLFNDVLTGHAKPGFRLFATVNPGSFEGRESMSPALKSRCTQIKLGELTQQEMVELIETLPNIPKGLSKWLVEHFNQLSNVLKFQSAPIQLTYDDLLRVAEHLSNQNAKTWPLEFKKHLSLAFRSLRTPLAPIQENQMHVAEKKKQEQQRLACEAILNSISELKKPITVQFGKSEGFKNGILTVSSQTSDKEVFKKYCSFVNNKVLNIKGRISQSKQTTKIAKVNQTENSSEYEFGDVLTTPHYDVIQYFPKTSYHYNLYRLELIETYLDETGQLRDHSINQQFKDVVPFVNWSNHLTWRTILENDEVSGQIDLTLHDKWQALPALTSMDELRAIQVTPEIEIDLARNKKTGQLLIKARSKISTPVHVEYIIAPDQIYFYPLNDDESVITQDDLCTERLRNLLDQHIFDSEYELHYHFNELRDINSINNIPQRLSALQSWLETFSTSKNVTGKNEELLLNMLKQKQGVCRHRAMVFQVLCQYWGIPVRQVRNATHAFVEVSADSGNSWRQYQLGGSEQATKNITELNWDKFTRREKAILDQPKGKNNGTNIQASTSSSLGFDNNRYEFSANLEAVFAPIREHIDNKEKVTNDNIQKLYIAFKTEIKKNNWVDISDDTNLMQNMYILLSPDFFKYVQQNQDWKDVISKVLKETGYIAKYQHHSGFARILSIYNQIEENGKSIPMSAMQRKDYIEWLCDLIEMNEPIKELLLGKLQSQIKKVSDFPCAERIMDIVSKTPYPDFKESAIKDDINKRNNWFGDEAAVYRSMSSLPHSTHLESKMSKVKIVEEYTRMPKDSSQLVPENILCDLPAFLSKTTLVQSKPIIIDLKPQGNELQLLAKNYQCEAEKKKGWFNDQIDTTLEFRSGYDYFEILMSYFHAWIASHKSDDEQVWHWISGEGNHDFCYTQESADQWPQVVVCEFNPSIPSYLPIDFSPEEIKKQIGQPSAIVLKHNDLVIMFKEFLYLVSG